MKTLSTLIMASLLTLTNTFAQTHQIDAMAIIEDGEVSLNWELRKETNTSYFVIERSVDNDEFETISTQRAAEYATQMSNYNFNDVEFEGERCTYRITLVTMEGTRVSSNVAIACASDMAVVQ